MAPAVPYPIAYWVEPNRLLAGEYPLPLDMPYGPRADARQRLTALLDAGVTTIVDLTEPGEQPGYLPLLAELAEARSIDVTHRRHALVDFAVPSDEVLAEIHSTIADALAADHTVYVHCKAGLGRTGTVVATYLMRTRGLPGEAAIAEVAQLRADVPDRRPSPFVEPQRAFVRGWQPQEARTNG